MNTAADRIVATLASFDGSEGYPTAQEIAQHTQDSPATVSAALRKLEAAGRVRKVGEAYSGARTWALT